jgi:membrane protease YdiL (CAAX protease family)
MEDNDSQVEQVQSPVRNWRSIITIPAWVVVCFFVAQLLSGMIDWLLRQFNLTSGINAILYNSVLTAMVYIITILLVVLVPVKLRKLRAYKVKWQELGLNRFPLWGDIFIVPAGIVVYFLLSALLISLASWLFPSFNINQPQTTGFNNLNANVEYILAFVSLIVIVPVAEELLFRGYLFGKLRSSIPVWLAIVTASVVFGALHGAWNVAIDTFALSVVLCVLRQITGSLWSSILLHAAKNSIAFYFLFINPVLLHTLVR